MDVKSEPDNVEMTDVKEEKVMTDSLQVSAQNDETPEKSSRIAYNVPDDGVRFEIELEFIQCLSRPAYLNFLAQNGYFDDPTFLKYLRYLQYWKEPKYAKFLMYPHCLAFLDLILEDENFRKDIARDDFTVLTHSQQFYHWQHFLNNRYKESARWGDIMVEEGAHPTPKT